MDKDFSHLELLDLENCIMNDLDYSTASDKAFTFRKTSFQDSTAKDSVAASQDASTANEREKQKIDEEGHDITELAREFGERTTAHGWGRVAKAPRHIVKLLWMTLTLLALTFSLIQIGLLVQKYLQFNTEMKWQLSMTEMEFPSVTICNIQPYSISTAESLMTNSTSQFYQWYNVTKNLDMIRGWADYLNRSKEFEWVENRMKQPIGYFENIGNEAQLVGHQALDFVIRCGFGFQGCNATNFTFYQSAVYFNCYTFNGGNVSRDTLISKTSGPQEGLSVILYLENDNGDDLGDSLEWGTYHTLSAVGNAGGARIIVHSPDTRPSPADRGIDVPPGFSANVGLDVYRHQRQDEPWNRCVVKEEWSSDRYVYSSHVCLAICQQRYVMHKCHCMSSTLPIVNTDIVGMNYCAFWNVTSIITLMAYLDTINCEASVLLEFASNETLKSQCDPPCDPPCEEFAYKTDLSYSYWPLDFTQEDFYHTLIVQNPNRDKLKAYNNLKQYNMSELIRNGMIRSNFARVNVYLKALTIEEYIEQKSYELPNLFSDIGGSFGLWIGMSIITWGEVIELTVHIIYHGGKRLAWMMNQPQHVKPTDKEKY